jgi:DNA-binding NarL/FixJ family response regulator
MSAIARIAPANNLRVALLCDRFKREEWQKFTDCGVNGYLLKSMNPAQITSKLEDLMNQKLGNELQTGYEEMG